MFFRLKLCSMESRIARKCRCVIAYWSPEATQLSSFLDHHIDGTWAYAFGYNGSIDNNMHIQLLGLDGLGAGGHMDAAVCAEGLHTLRPVHARADTS